MQHMRFKAEQTAAHYVANGLGTDAQEAFELHMMDCDECCSDVEVWRALKSNLPEAANERTSGLPRIEPARASGTASTRPLPAARQVGAWTSGLRMAASLAGVAVVGGLGGWFAHSARGPGPALAEGLALVYNLPPVTRGISCAPLPLNGHASIVLLRIPEAAPGSTVLAQGADGAALGTSDYSARLQDDGSWVLQFQAAALRNRAISLSIQGSGGSAPESLGCITGLGPG